jgi:dihydropyrimidinase
VLTTSLSATVSDIFSCDIGIKGGRIVALGEGLDESGEVIDAIGKCVLPGGI